MPWPQKLMYLPKGLVKKVSMRMDVHSKGIKSISFYQNFTCWDHKIGGIGFGSIHALCTFDYICEQKSSSFHETKPQPREKFVTFLSLFTPSTDLGCIMVGRRALPFWPVEEVGYHSAGIACIVSTAPVGMFWMQTIHRNDMFQVNLVVAPSKQHLLQVFRKIAWAACFSSCR